MQVEIDTIEQDAVSTVEPADWRGLGLLDKLIIGLLPLLALIFAILPFLDQALLLQARQAGGLRPFVDWLVNSGGAWIMAAGMLGLWIIYLLIKRSRLVNNEHLWVDAGCPQCQERELIRVTRERSDRFYNLLGIPVYRYACRNCTWRGLRIGRRHRPFYADPIAEELALAAVAVGQGEMPAAQAAALEARRQAEAAAESNAAEAAVTDEAATPGPGANVEDDARADAPVDTVQESAGNDVTTGDDSNDDDLDWLWQRLNDEK